MDSDEPVVGNSEVKKLEDRVRELERMLGRNGGRDTPRSPFESRLKKTDIAADLVAEGRFPMKAVANTLGGVPFQPRGAVERQIKAARALSEGRGCRASARHSQVGGSEANLWLSADRRAPQSRKASRR